MSVCILTDSAVQFPNPVFEGRNRVTILPSRWEGEQNGNENKSADFPKSLIQGVAPIVSPSSEADFNEIFHGMAARCEGILAILSSAYFDESLHHAISVAEDLQGTVPIRVIDSKNTSLGLGILVEKAAQAAEAGMNLTDLELSIRSLLPRIYTLLCIPGLSYLQRKKYLNESQALVAEHLGMLPLFTLDNGALLAGEKARNKRHLVDILQEFLAEFSELEHISLLQGIPSFEQETRALRERLAEDHASTPISEQIIGAPLASVIGPHSLGVFALQQE